MIVFSAVFVYNTHNKLGKLFVCYGAVFLVLGIPLLCGQNSPYIFFSVVGVMIETIAVMIVYSVRIEKKYREP